MTIEIGPYRGTGEDLADLIARAWDAGYGNRSWFPVWDRRYIEWRMLDPRIIDRELMVCAYVEDQIAGCLIAEATPIRVHDRTYSGTLTSYLSVDPQTKHRGLALQLVERQTALHRERGIEFSLGITNASRKVAAKSFWDAVGRRRPGELACLGSFRMWAAVVSPAAVARAGLDIIQRVRPWIAGLVPWGWYGKRGVPVRAYRAKDLDACRQWTLQQGAAADIQMVWTPQRLAVQLEHPYVRTWVCEVDGAPRGFVNAYLIEWRGAAPVRVGFIELCAGAAGFDLTGILIAAARALADERAEMIVMMDSGTQPRRALLAAGFLPVNPDVDILALLGPSASRLPKDPRLHWVFN